MTGRSVVSPDQPAPRELRLRPLIASDRSHLEKLLRDRPLQHLLLAYPPGASSADVDGWMERRIGGGDLVCFAIADDENRFCGFAQISGWHRRGRLGWLGIALVPERRAQGLGKRALKALIEAAGRDLGLRKLLLEVRADNAAAINLYRGMGFRTVGEFREHYFDGADYHDVLVMERMAAGA